MIALAGCAQTVKKGVSDKTLLWKISGNGSTQPSYLFGTIHMLCADDAVLSDNLKKAIADVSEVYFEVDMDNMMEMLTILGKMKMKGDTTLKDLLSETDYQKVKDYFEKQGSMLPFSMLETYKPMLAASTLGQSNMPCESVSMMEQVIMEEAKKKDKKIQGLESMSYQAGVLDKIPYKIQAEQLVTYVNNIEKDNNDDKELAALMDAYRQQDLKKLEDLMMQSELGMKEYTDVLLVDRNKNWIEELKKILPKKSVLVAVGAGHLPGNMGVINLLRKAGYTVEPVENDTTKSKKI